MPSSSPAPLPFWRELIIQAFRIGIRIAWGCGRISLAELKLLLHVAIFRELKARGIGHHAMSLTLNCSPGTVRSMSRQSRDFGGSPHHRGIFGRLMSRLQEGSASRAELARLIPEQVEFDATHVALAWLEEQGWVSVAEVQGVQQYHICQSRPPPGLLESPLQALERSLRCSLLLLHAVPTGAIAQTRLFQEPELSFLPPSELHASLRFLEGRGWITHETSAAGDVLWRRLIAAHQLAIPDDALARLRVGLLDFLDKTGEFLEFRIRHPDETQFGQRGFLLLARRAEIDAFLAHHRQEVVEQLLALESRAVGASDAVECLMVWAFSPRQ